jgi:hypothetical protein
MTEKIESCGCERLLVNGKWIWIYCDEHDTTEFSYTPKIQIRKVSARELAYD